jgi:hypothetical protein
MQNHNALKMLIIYFALLFLETPTPGWHLSWHPPLRLRPHTPLLILLRLILINAADVKHGAAKDTDVGVFGEGRSGCAVAIAGTAG